MRKEKQKINMDSGKSFFEKNRLVFCMKKYCSLFFYAFLERCIMLTAEVTAVIDNLIFEYRHLKSNNAGLWKYVKTFFKVSSKHPTPFKTIFNYVMPVIMLILTVSVINGQLHKAYALDVVYNDVKIGQIKNETVFNDAISMVGEILLDSDDTTNFIAVPQYKLVQVRPSSLSDSSKISEKIIEKSDGTFENGSGLFIDGKFIAAMKSGSDIRTVLGKLESVGSTFFNAGNAEIVNDVEIKIGLYPKDEILNINDFVQKLTGKNLNSLQQNIYSSNGIISLKVTKIENYYMDIPYETEEKQDSSILSGYERVITEGEYGSAKIKEISVYVDGYKESGIIVENTVLKEPVTEELLVGVRLPQNAQGLAKQYGKLFGSPISGGFVSSGFMTEERPTHRGIDLAIAAGANIYATCGGVVTFSGWSDDGAGYNVIIDHQNGFITRYAHCSALYVEQDAVVTQGQIIAAVGMTGNATGNHVHYEIKYNGYQIDPWPFIFS